MKEAERSLEPTSACRVTGGIGQLSFPGGVGCSGSEIPRRTDYLKFDETRRTSLAKMPALGRGRAVIGRKATRR